MLGFVLFLSTAPVQAQTLVNFSGPATGWRVQYYVGTNPGVTLYNTPSSCASGQLGLPSTATEDEQNRLWALLLSAKATGQSIGFFYYVNSAGSCIIASFYLTP